MARPLTGRLDWIEASFVRSNQMYTGMQAAINFKMRAILIDWLVEVRFKGVTPLLDVCLHYTHAWLQVALKWQLQADTLYLCVNLIDRVLARFSVQRSQLQLISVTCLLIAAYASYR